MIESNPTILCVDDDRDNCELVETVFKLADYKVVTCGTAEDGIDRARKEKFGAIILDNRLSDSTGAEICRAIRSFDHAVPIVFFSGEARESEIGKAFASGANAYLVKPNDFEKLTLTVIKLIEEHYGRT